MITRDLLRDETGVSAIEYTVIIALIAISLVGALSTLGTETGNTYSEAGAAMGPAASPEAEPEPEATPSPRVPTRPGGGNRVPRG